MLPSFKLSRYFVAVAALALAATGVLPTSAADASAVNYDAIFNSQKFKGIEDLALQISIRSGLTSEGLRQAAKEGINKYLQDLPAGKKPDATKLETAALKGMLASLSPHDGYMDLEQSKRFSQQMSSNFVGLGVIFSPQEDEGKKEFKIVKPMPKSPAERAGIKPGDIIRQVNEHALDGLDLEDGIKLLVGEPGSRADLKIERNGNLIDISVVRAAIKQENARYKMLEGGVAHIHVLSFVRDISADVRNVVAQAKADAQLDPVLAANGGLKGVILDFTYDSGGLVSEAVRIVDDFLDKEGPVVTQQGRLDEFTDRHAATHGDIISGLPLVVLVNEMSASASEIVAGAFQDHERAIIMGRDTFGKGTVQQVHPLRDNTAVKITIAVFKRPSGHSNQWVGVKPDILVETRDADYEKLSSSYPSERSLPNSIQNEIGFEAEKDKTKSVCTPVSVGIKIEKAGTDKNIFNEASGTINPFIACARDFILKQVNPAYTPKFTNTVPKLPALTN